MTPRAYKLAASISDNVSKVQVFLALNNLPDLSIDQDIPVQFQTNQEFASSRDAAILACRELLAMLQGGFGTIADQTAIEFANTQALCRFKIASNFPAGKDRLTYSELARECHIPEREIRRIVRASLPSYIFREIEPGVIAHTAASRMLATNPSMCHWVDGMASEIIPAALKFADAMERWPGSEEPNQAGYSVANSTNMTAFEYMAQSPGRTERFAAAMSLFKMVPGYSPKWLLERYPWDSVSAGVVVDMTGAHGEYSIPIAQNFPNVKCVIQDIPEAVAKTMSSIPSDLRGRVSVMEHDYFTEQPMKGAEVYLLKWVLHGWPDKYARNILRALIPALKRGSKIVLHEYILPESEAFPTLGDKTVRIFDTIMRALTNGKERGARDWEALFASADSRFRVEKIETPPMSSLGIIEVGWEG